MRELRGTAPPATLLAALVGRTLLRLDPLLQNRPLLIFAICMVLFQVANASMLPLVNGMLANEGKGQAAPLVAALIIVPRVALLAPWVGQRAEKRGRKALLLVGFAALPIRAALEAIGNLPRK